MMVVCPGLMVRDWFVEGVGTRRNFKAIRRVEVERHLYGLNPSIVLRLHIRHMAEADTQGPFFTDFLRVAIMNQPAPFSGNLSALVVQSRKTASIRAVRKNV